MPKRALLILAEGFEETEAIAPCDALRRSGVQVVLAGLDSLEVKGAHGVKVKAEVLISDIKDDFDALVLPGGGIGAKNLSASAKVTEIISSMHKKGKIIAAICASPAMVLSPTGILDGKRATGYPGTERNFAKGVKVTGDDVVCDGNILTSKGPGTALHFGIKLAELLAGKETSEEIKKKMLIK